MARRITNELKESIIQKALLKGSKHLSDIAKEHGVGFSTLAGWLSHLKNKKSAKIPNRTEQFRHLQAIAKLNETEVGAYCRQHGLYAMHLKEWENDFMKPNLPDQKYKAEIIELRKKNADLERELRRKEKALAEVAALLILKKKADAIWGECEDV